MTLLNKILVLLTSRERRRGLLLLVMVTCMAALEITGIVSVMPFLSVLGNPQIVTENQYLSLIYEGLGFESVDTFVLALGASAFALILLSALFRIVTHYAMYRFIEMRRHSIGVRLLETYLRQPYAFFLNRHSSDMAKAILSEVDQLVHNVIRPGVEMVAHGLVLVALVILLFVVDSVLAIIITATLGGMYGLIYASVRGLLARIGSDRVRANRERFAAAGEALGGIKDIKLLGREHTYLRRFRGPSLRFASHQATSQTLSQAPNFVVEAAAFGGIIALTLGLIALHGGVANGGVGGMLPILGLYAFAGLRMKPAAQKVYQGMAKLRFGHASLQVLHDDLRHRDSLAELNSGSGRSLTPHREIALREIHYRYPGSEVDSLEGINLRIEVGTSVGFVGETGAGKTSLVDLVLGLLRPTSGTIEVDGTPITENNLRDYQQALGYVPQNIFLTDASVEENIALGVPIDEIDHDQVVRCACMAQVNDFIMEELPNQYATVIGERGVRLSGGQRQRMGIARALYHDPDVIVFDEATSALDSSTEQAVMEAMATLHKQKTLLLIAHRVDTVRECDVIVVLDSGRVVAKGGFDELQRTSERFRAIAGKT